MDEMKRQTRTGLYEAQIKSLKGELKKKTQQLGNAKRCAANVDKVKDKLRRMGKERDALKKQVESLGQIPVRVD